MKINNQEKKIYKILKRINKNFKNDISITNQLDSIQMLDLISSIEKNFGIKISNKDINNKNFLSIETISKLIYKNVKS